MMAALQAGYRSREDRVKVLIPSRMRLDSSWCDVVIHNISSRGMMVASDQPPPARSYVEIRRGTQVIVGKVMWTKGRFFGLKSQDRLSVQAIVAEPRLAGKPQAAADRQSTERRADSRLIAEAQLARRVERSRAVASLVQYGVIAAGAIAVASIAGGMVFDTLARPSAAIVAGLGGASVTQ